MNIQDRCDGAGVDRRGIERWLLPMALLAVGIWFVPLSHTCLLACVPGDLGDARFNGIVLEHFHRWVTGQDTSLLSAPFFHPLPGTITFSDNHWGTAWIYSIFRALGWDRYQAFDLWYLVGYIANFVVGHLVFRKMRFSPLASALAAFAFTFAMPVLARHGHAQLTYRLLVPVALLLWQRFSENLRWRWLALLSLAVVGQFYVSIYLGYFLLLLLAAWAVSQWVIQNVGPRQWFNQWLQWRERSVRAEVMVSLAIIAIAGAAFVALMYPYLYYSKLYGFQRSIEEVALMTPRPASYLLADGSSIWSRFSANFGNNLPMRHEHQMFFGVGILGLALLGLWRSDNRMKWVAALSLVLLGLLTITIHGMSLYLLLAKLPGVGSVRAVARIGLVLLLPLCILAALGIDVLWRSRSEGKPLLIALAVLMIAESATFRIFTFERAEAIQRVDALRHTLPPHLPADTVLFNPMRPDKDVVVTELDGVVLAQDLGYPTLNGYSGNVPPGFEPLPAEAPCMQVLMRIRAVQAFAQAHASLNLAASKAQAVRVLGRGRCEDLPAQPVPLAHMAMISLTIESITSDPEGYRVRAVVRNHTRQVLNTSSAFPHPLRLSWQYASDRPTLDAMAWIPRVELGNEPLRSGEQRPVEFLAPRMPVSVCGLALSAVIEGHGWSHEQAVAPARIALPDPECER